jgi:predicted HicB family RNase H-like nuclease
MLLEASEMSARLSDVIFIRSEPDLRARLNAAAKRDGVSAAELARAALRAALMAGASRDRAAA